jgi:D-alanyl-D-alanine carboxypeptidase
MSTRRIEASFEPGVERARRRERHARTSSWSIVSSRRTASRACTALVVLVACGSTPPATSRERTLETVVTDRFVALAADGTPGALLSVRRRTNARWERFVFGVADVDSGAPLHDAMRFRVGSVAKSWVATAALRLAHEGRLDLDAPIDRHLEGVPGGDRITARMLGTHRSGLADAIAQPELRARINRDPTLRLSREEILEVALRARPHFPPGEGTRYANTNTILLAQLLERIDGRPIDVIVRERVLESFGARHAGLFLPLEAPHPRGYRHGERVGVVEYGTVFFDATRFDPSWANAAGDAIATLADLEVFAAPIATGTWAPSTASEVRRALDEGFGLQRFEGARGHAGDVPGFSAFFAHDEARGVTVVALSNLSNTRRGEQPAEELGRTVLRELGSRE